jgi:hypothetical protein
MRDMHLRCDAGMNTIKNTKHPSLVAHYPGAIFQVSDLSLISSMLSSGQKTSKLHDLDTYDRKTNPEQWIALYEIAVRAV